MRVNRNRWSADLALCRVSLRPGWIRASGAGVASAGGVSTGGAPQPGPSQRAVPSRLEALSSSASGPRFRSGASSPWAWGRGSPRPGSGGPRGLQRNRCLRLVRVLGADAELHLRQHVPADLVLRHHPLDGQLQDPLGPALEELPGILFLLPAGVPAVALVRLLLPLVPGEDDLLHVRDDDEIAGVDVRSVRRPVLAHQDRRDLRGQSPHDHVGRVDHVPLLGQLSRLRLITVHERAHLHRRQVFRIDPLPRSETTILSPSRPASIPFQSTLTETGARSSADFGQVPGVAVAHGWASSVPGARGRSERAHASSSPARGGSGSTW